MSTTASNTLLKCIGRGTKESLPSMTTAQAVKVLIQTGTWLPHYRRFDEDFELAEYEHGMKGPDQSLLITFNDGSKAEYCDGDYIVKE